MRKNTPLLALLLAVTAGLLFLPPSLSGMRDAARPLTTIAPSVTARTIPAPTPTLPARVLYGPRRRSRRAVPIAPETPKAVAPIPAEVIPIVTEPVPVTTAKPAAAHLEELLAQSGAREPQTTLARSVLSLLDPECVEKLETLHILYGNPQHRGLAGRGTVILSGEVPDEEFIGLLLHEGLGHFRDITCLTGTAGSGASGFRDGSDPVWNDDPSSAFYRISWLTEDDRKNTARRDDFVTGYAYEGDSFEDLAESVTYYMTQEEAFRERAAQNPALATKLSWLETYMPKSGDIAKGNAWDGRIAWDATKLSFRWTEGQ